MAIIFYDYDDGNDGNDGLSTYKPKKTLPLQTASANNVHLGKRGTRTPIAAYGAFSGGSNVTIGSWGDADAPPHAFYASASLTYLVNVDGIANITIQDTEFDGGTSAALTWRGTSTGIIQRCVFTGWDNVNAQSTASAVRLQSWNAANRLKFLNNEIHNIGRDGMYCEGISNVLIEGNYIHDLQKLDPSGNGGADWDADGIQIADTGANTPGNVIIRRNRIVNPGGKHCIIAGSSDLTSSTLMVIEDNYLENASVGLSIRSANVYARRNHIVGGLDTLWSTHPTGYLIYIETNHVAPILLESNTVNGSVSGTHALMISDTASAVTSRNNYYGQVDTDVIGFDSSAGSTGSLTRTNDVYDSTGISGYIVNGAGTSVTYSATNNAYVGNSGSGFKFGASTYATLALAQAGGHEANSALDATITAANGTSRPAESSILTKGGIHTSYRKDRNGRWFWNPPSIGPHESLRRGL